MPSNFLLLTIEITVYLNYKSCVVVHLQQLTRVVCDCVKKNPNATYNENHDTEVDQSQLDHFPQKSLFKNVTNEFPKSSRLSYVFF